MIGNPGAPLRLPSILARFVVFSLLSVALMMLDHRGQHLQKFRTGLGVLTYPIEMVAAAPARAGAAIMGFVGGDRALRAKYDTLNAEYPLVLAKLEKLDALEAENNHLRSLLGSAERVAERMMAAELIEVSQEPFTRKIVIAKGGGDNVYVGQPIIDAYGIMGQITEVGMLQSRATLITDPDHAIPVQVTRNGLRAIVFGTGERDGLAVRYLTSSADIREGDTLVSSGMGGTFPFGYPVAVVTHIVNDPNESFLDISARPVAHLGHNKEVLLIWPSSSALINPAQKPPAAPAKAVTPAKPAKPVNPAVPAATAPPVAPAKPAKSATPATPMTPASPAAPAPAPATTVTPATPAKPAAPAVPAPTEKPQ